MKILLTGGTGGLGPSVQSIFESLGYEVYAPSHRQMDVTKAEAVSAHMKFAKPDAVIHCAAYSKVDLAESQRELCRNVNVCGTKNIAEICQQQNIYLIYISTDYVFDGKRKGYYQTDDPRNPLSVYGRSKADGEEIVLSRDPGNSVVRISWLFGEYSENFISKILRLGQNREWLDVVCDQIGSPTYSRDIASLLADVCDKRPPGILHATNENICTRAQLAQAALHMAGISCTVNPVLSSCYPAAAPRPMNSRLDKTCLDRAGLKRLPPWEKALSEYLKK